MKKEMLSNDSKCLSVVNRPRGTKGYRLLQGDNLKALLLSLTSEQVGRSKLCCLPVIVYFDSSSLLICYTEFVG